MIEIKSPHPLKTHLHHLPNMVREASLCVYERSGAFLEEMLDGNNRFGQTEAQMRGLLGDLLAYWDAVMPEVRGMIADQEALLPYFDTRINHAALGHWMTVAKALTHSYPGECWGVDSEEAIDTLADRVVIMALSDTLDDDIPHITKLEDPLGYLYQAEEIDDAQKLFLIRFLSVRRQVVPQICALLERIALVLEKHYALVRPAVDSLYARLDTGERTFDSLSMSMNFQVGLPVEAVDMYISVFGFNSMIMNVFDDEKSGRVYYGLYVGELQALAAEHALDSVTDLKAIADLTRWRILRMLTRERLYLSEIAERLSLTPATVLHHLDVLTNELLINLHAEEHAGRKPRVHYSANTANLDKIAAKIHRVAAEVNHGQTETEA